MTELEQYEIKLIKNYLAGEHLYPSRFEKNVQGNIESNYEYSYRENINNDTHNLTKQRVNINSQIRLFAEQMSHYDRQFSRSMYFDADSNENNYRDIEEFDINDILDITILVSKIEYFADYSLVNYYKLETLLDKLTVLYSKPPTEITFEETEKNNLIKILSLKIRVIMNIIARCIPDNFIKPVSIELKDYDIECEELKNAWGIIEYLYRDRNNYDEEVIKKYCKSRPYYKYYFDVLETTRTTTDDYSILDQDIKLEKINPKSDISESYADRIKKSPMRFRDNTKLSYLIKNKNISSIDENLIQLNHKKDNIENYYRIVRIADYYSELVNGLPEDSDDTDMLLSIKNKIIAVLNELNEIRITPFKTSVVPYILPPDECVYDIEFSRESNNSQKEYKLLLLHPLIKIYNSIAVNNQIEKKIFECYQLIAKIDDLAVHNKAKKQYEEFKSERVRSVEILSIFAAVVMFSTGSINIIADQKNITYVAILIATFGVVLLLFVSGIHFLINQTNNRRFYIFISFLLVISIALVIVLVVNFTSI